MGGDSMTTWCAGLLLLVAGCLCVSYLRFAISGMRLFAVGLLAVTAGVHSAIQWEWGLAHSAPGRPGCPTSSASGGLCAGERGQAPWACRAVLCGNAG